jgi:hypothetical protein
MIRKGAAPRRSKDGKAAPLVGTFKGGAGHRWSDGRPLDRNKGLGPVVAIVAWNIIELELDFHGSDAGPLPTRDWAPCRNTSFYRQPLAP